MRELAAAAEIVTGAMSYGRSVRSCSLLAAYLEEGSLVATMSCAPSAAAIADATQRWLDACAPAPVATMARFDPVQLVGLTIRQRFPTGYFCGVVCRVSARSGECLVEYTDGDNGWLPNSEAIGLLYYPVAKRARHSSSSSSAAAGDNREHSASARLEDALVRRRPAEVATLLARGADPSAIASERVSFRTCGACWALVEAAARAHGDTFDLALGSE